MSEIDFSEAEKTIGYRFRDKKLLKKCFVHASYSNERKGEENNEGLEFLGDAVLELIFTEKLYFEGGGEGSMTDRRQKLVSDDSLEKTVTELGLDRFLLYGGRRENLGKKAIPSLLEALIAGIYLDGGYEEAKKFVLSVVKANGSVNYKKELQEYTQGCDKKDLPVYRCIGKEGKDNAPLFTASVFACGASAVGKGRSKQLAEIDAAKNLLKIIKKNK